MANGTASIIHESETQRQFVRLKMPSMAEWDGRRHTVRDLSSGGLALGDVKGPLKAGKRLAFTLILPFEKFSLDLPLRAEVKHYDSRTGMAGCRFVDLDTGQLSILHHVLRSYIAGDVVDGPDVLNIVARNNFVNVRKNPAMQRPHIGTLIKNTVIYCALLLGAIGVGMFLYKNAAQRLFTLSSANGVVDVQAYDVTAPSSGIFRPSVAARAGAVQTGMMIGTIMPPVGLPDRTVRVLSPCDCLITERHVMSGQYAMEGSPLVSLIPQDAQGSVSALYPTADIHKIRIGMTVAMTIVGGGERLTGRVSDIQSTDKILDRPGSMPVTASLVRIVADDIIPPELAGRPVFTRIDLREPE